MAINIPIIDSYRLKSYPYGYILVQETGGREQHIAFCNSIEHLIKIMIQRKIRGFNSTSLHSLIESIKGFETRLCKSLQVAGLDLESINTTHHQKTSTKTGGSNPQPPNSKVNGGKK